MTIRKAIVATGLALVFGMGTASAAEGTNAGAPNSGKIGLGFQGIVAGSLLQGLSGRYWASEKVGTELNLFYGKVSLRKSENNDIININHDTDGNLLLATGKLIYAPVVKKHSLFYVGIEGGVGRVKYTQDSITSTNGTVYLVNPLIGSEFSFSEIPELGFNFEAGYKLHLAGPINLNYTSVSVGAHYFF